MSTAEALTTVVLLLLAGSARSDLATDETQCRDQLMSLAPCLGFVSGQSRFPSQQCCSVLVGNFNATHKCMCVLVKDRNELNGFGIIINATLALSLPSICHAHSNASKCIDILGLSWTSQEAQVFIQFDNNTRANGSTTALGLGAVAASATATAPRGLYANAKFEAMLVWCLVLTWLMSL